MANKDIDKEFLEFVIKSVVSHPEEVTVTRTVDEMGVLLTLKVHKEDMGQVIGKQGSTARAIRTILRIIGVKNNARINLKIEEPEGGQGPTRARSAQPEVKKNVDQVVDELRL